uniref:Uncharacterized protein n=1 Tax=Cucumis melo TaxID=3656 RepID=A0A9I9E2N1_CUCME
MNLFLFFTGQDALAVGMGKESQSVRTAADLFKRANDILGTTNVYKFYDVVGPTQHSHRLFRSGARPILTTASLSQSTLNINNGTSSITCLKTYKSDSLCIISDIPRNRITTIIAYTTTPLTCPYNLTYSQSFLVHDFFIKVVVN